MHADSSFQLPRWRNIRRRLWLIPLLIVLLVFAGVGVLFLRSDYFAFRPRLPRIMKLVEEQRAATPQIPAFLARCIDQTYGEDVYVARHVLWEFGMNETTHSRWIVRQYFWQASLKWHLSREDRRLIFCHFISDLDGHLGIHHVAQKLYQKPLVALDDRQLASLVAVARSPTRYLSDRAKLDEATERLLGELR